LSEYKWGLALGSGGARGYAHVPLLDIIEENGINLTAITGSSIGSVIGAAYALHADSRKVKKLTYLFTSKNKEKIDQLLGMVEGSSLSESLNIARKTAMKRAVMPEDFLYEMVMPIFGDATFDDTQIKLGIVATDIAKSQSRMITTGYIVDAVCASASVPGTFAPTRLGGTHFIDGGVICPVPVQQCLDLGAEHVIAVDISKNVRKTKYKNALDLMAYVNQLKQERLVTNELKKAEIKVRFPNLNYDWYRFDQQKEIIASAKELLDDFRKELNDY